MRAGYIEAHRAIGQLLIQQGDKAYGEAELRLADQLTQKKADAQAAQFALSAGRERAGQGDAAGALERFREAVRLDPGNARARYQLAQALRKAGRRAEAARHMAEAVRLAPYLEP
jgi:Flp pilus assembly protein TadD